MKLESVEQANSLNLCDATVLGIIRQKGSKDLVVHLRLNSGIKALMTFYGFTNLKLSLDCKDLSESLTWEVRFIKSGRKKWKVEFDFAGAPEGVLNLDCKDITFEEEIV